MEEQPGDKRKHDDGSESWRVRIAEHAHFPHPLPESWLPFSNYSSSRLGNFTGMHGDELRQEEEEEDGEDGEDNEHGQVADWEFASIYSKYIKPCPHPVLAGIKEGDLVLWFFGAPYNAWYLGVVTKVQSGRAALPVHAEFEDGMSRLAPQKEEYGVTGGKEWALLSELPRGMELTGFAAEALKVIAERRRVALRGCAGASGDVVELDLDGVGSVEAGSGANVPGSDSD